MAVQIVKPVDTEFSMSPLAVEANTETADEFTWVSLNCCAYTYYDHTDVDDDFEEDIDV